MSDEKEHPMDVLSQELRRARAMSEMLAVYACEDTDRALDVSNEGLSSYAYALEDHLTAASRAFDDMIQEDINRREREREAAEAPPPDPSGHIAAIDDCLIRMRVIAHAAHTRKEKLGELLMDDLGDLGTHWRAIRTGGTDHD